MEGTIWAVFILVVIFIWAVIDGSAKEKARKEHVAKLDRLEKQIAAAQVAREQKRLALIEQMRGEWGDELCERLINKKVTLDMNQRMVAYSWGKPDEVDQKTISKTGIDRERWVYGEPRKGAQYVYFKNGLVDKIQSS